jgi:HEAT repeat protein
MKIIFLISFTIISLLNSPVIFSQQNSVEFLTSEKEILELQDSRTLGEDNKLLKYLHSVDPKTRELAIYALANIGDSTFIDQLNFLLAGPFEDYPNKEDLTATAFLLGQIPSQKSIEMISFLMKNLPDNAEEKIFVLSKVADAIGKTGNENDLNKICSLYSSSNLNDTALTRAVSMSIARFALRKIKNEKSVESLKLILKNSSDTIALRNSAYAFWRIGDKKLLEKAAEEIYQLAESKDSQTRMWAYNATGKLQNELFLLYTLESFNSEKDWRVKVNMLNSLLNYELDSLSDLTKQLYSIIGDGIGDENEHISLTAINVFGKMFKDLNNSKNTEAKKLSKEILRNFKLALDSAASLNLSVRIQSELSNSMALIYKDEVKNFLLKKFSKSDNYELKAAILKSIRQFQ